MSMRDKKPTVDTVMEAWQQDATPPTWSQILEMKREHRALTDLRDVAERKNGIIRTLYARIHKLEAALRELHDATQLVSVGKYDQEAHDIAVSRALYALGGKTDE